MKKIMKNDDDSNWRYTLKREFINVKTINIHYKMVIFFEKMMKAYSKAVIL